MMNMNDTAVGLAADPAVVVVAVAVEYQFYWTPKEEAIVNET
jgi:hypothetical protein